MNIFRASLGALLVSVVLLGPIVVAIRWAREGGGIQFVETVDAALRPPLEGCFMEDVCQGDDWVRLHWETETVFAASPEGWMPIDHAVLVRARGRVDACAPLGYEP